MPVRICTNGRFTSGWILKLTELKGLMALYCNDPLNKGCSWSGDPQELVALTDALDDRDFSFCPNCDGKDFQEEEDDEE
jgi:hypothetical protein